MSRETVVIRYRRLPDRTTEFRQVLLEDAGDHVVTFLPAAALERPVTAGKETLLEPGAPVVWFTYRGLWYDVGRFHLADGTFTGVYANVLTPVRMEGLRWETTDLCLDVWMGLDGQVRILDESEFARAVERGWIDPETAAAARETAESIALLARQGGWPAPHVHEWTLERARERLAESE